MTACTLTEEATGVAVESETRSSDPVTDQMSHLFQAAAAKEPSGPLNNGQMILDNACGAAILLRLSATCLAQPPRNALLGCWRCGFRHTSIAARNGHNDDRIYACL
eukprot:jgi/Chlat1/5486/Chrsp36S05461